MLSSPRSRIINFRLSEQEYVKLKSACSAQGSRCLSDFARTAVLSLADSEPPADASIQTRLARLDSKVSSLGDRLHRLVELLDVRQPD